MVSPGLQIFVGESHRLLQICLWREQDFRLLDQCWAQLRSEGGAFSLMKQDKQGGRSVSLRVELKAQTNYIEGKKDDAAGLLTLNVATDWLLDVIVLWSTMKQDDNRQYVWSNKKGNRGSNEKGYRLEIVYGTKPNGLEQPYKLSRFPKS